MIEENATTLAQSISHWGYANIVALKTLVHKYGVNTGQNWAMTIKGKTKG